MKGIDLIKSLNRGTLEEDPVRKAMEELNIEFNAPSVDDEENGDEPMDDYKDSEMGDSEDEMPDEEMGDSEDEMPDEDDAELIAKVTKDIEVMGFSPQEMEKLVPKLVDLIKDEAGADDLEGGTSNIEVDFDEDQMDDEVGDVGNDMEDEDGGEDAMGEEPPEEENY